MLKKSRQQMLDEAMCKPGWTYNEVLDKCIGAYGPMNKEPAPVPEKPPAPTPDLPVEVPTNAAPNSGQQHAASRGGKTGRKSVRISSNGVVQQGVNTGVK